MEIFKLLKSCLAVCTIPRFFMDEESEIVSNRGWEILETKSSEEINEVIKKSDALPRPLTVIKICDNTNLYHVKDHAMLDTNYLDPGDTIMDEYGEELEIISHHVIEHRYCNESLASAAGATGWDNLNPWRTKKVDCILVKNKTLKVGDIVYRTTKYD